MGIFLIGCVLIIIGLVVFLITDFIKTNWLTAVSAIIIIVSITSGIGLILFSLCEPVGSYKENGLISSQEIVSYEILETENYYIESNEFVTYFVINEILSDNGKEIETSAVTKMKSDVEIIKVKDCKIPRVEEYLMKWESSNWSFAKEKDKTLYKIYIPE